jgi:hypothetical protein
MSEQVKEEVKVIDAPVVPESRGFKSFRNTLEVENFYRFIHDNDLRREAKIMLEFIQSKLVTTKKKRRSSKENLH